MELFTYEAKYQKFVDEQKALLHEKKTKEEISKYFDSLYVKMWGNLDQK